MSGQQDGHIVLEDAARELTDSATIAADRSAEFVILGSRAFDEHPHSTIAARPVSSFHEVANAGTLDVPQDRPQGAPVDVIKQAKVTKSTKSRH